MRNRRGFELAISTMIIITLGIILLIGLVMALTGSFGNLSDKIKGYSMSDIDSLGKICQSQCNLQANWDFCCGEKMLGKEKITCSDDRIKIDCDINCEGVC